MQKITVRSLEFQLFAITFSINLFFIFKHNLMGAALITLLFLVPLSYLTHGVVIRGRKEEHQLYTKGIIYFSLIMLDVLMIGFSYYFIYYADWLITGSANFSQVGGLAIANYLLVSILRRTKPTIDDLHNHATIYTIILIFLLPLIFFTYFFANGIIPEPGYKYNLLELIYSFTGAQLLCFILIKENVDIKLSSAYKGFIGLIVYFSIIATAVSSISIDGTTPVPIESLDIIPTLLSKWNGDVLRILLSWLNMFHYFILLEVSLIGINKLKDLLVDKKEFANDRTKEFELQRISRNNMRIYLVMLIGFAIFSYYNGGNELAITADVANIATSLIAIIVSLMATKLSNKISVSIIAMYMILLNTLLILESIGVIMK